MMTIQEAKEQIEKSVRIYLMKDEYGNYRIPLERQRPIFLLGAPGIGKTAIMEQIARELNISLVTYSMTHHTRQSALGLPFIVSREYGEEKFDVSRYTMSEIIASVYENMEKSGKKEGILFLDEINCVSETLGPSMLQFLQYKIFGNHRVPRGWVIVTAGNPPEFNRSVREFDVVTMDRLKVLEVEPDYEAWKIYAQKKGLHQAILTFLDIKKEDFYQIENTVDGRNYVTARGWEDLSEAITLYEENGFEVDQTLVAQYLRNKRITGEFAAYYELYNKYRTDYKINEILEGTAGHAVNKRAKNATFDERISIMGLLLEAVLPQIRENIELEDALKELMPHLKEIKAALLGGASGAADGTQAGGGTLGLTDASRGGVDARALLSEKIDEWKANMDRLEAASGLSGAERRKWQYMIRFAREASQKIRLVAADTNEAAFAVIQTEFASRVEIMREDAKKISRYLENIFRFAEENFGDGNEMLVLVTELTVNYSSARFIAEHGCDLYYKYNKKFLLYERNRALMDELEKLTQNEEIEESLLI